MERALRKKWGRLGFEKYNTGEKILEDYSDKLLHIRSLEKYHPGYKDRDLRWAKIFFNLVQGDPETEMLDEIDWGRYIKFILLELQAKRPIPLNNIYLTKKGFDLKKRPISKTIKMLQGFVSIVNQEDFFCGLEEEKDKEKDKDKEKEEEAVTHFDKKETTQTIFQKWNVFASENGLSKILTLSDARKKKLLTRIKEPRFEFDKILSEIKRSDFLLGKVKDWKVDFDFVIESETNYLKILEGRYRNNGTNSRQGPRGTINTQKYAEELATIPDGDAGLGSK